MQSVQFTCHKGLDSVANFNRMLHVLFNCDFSLWKEGNSWHTSKPNERRSMPIMLNPSDRYAKILSGIVLELCSLICRFYSIYLHTVFTVLYHVPFSAHLN